MTYAARDPHPAPSCAGRGPIPGSGCRGTLRGPRLQIHTHLRLLRLQGRPWPGLGRVLLPQPLRGQEGGGCCGGWTRRGPREEPRPTLRAAALGGPRSGLDPRPPLPRADLTHASHQPFSGWAGPQGASRPADLQPGSGQQLPQGLLRLPDLQLPLPPKEGQRLPLFPPVQLQGGEEQPQDSPGPPPAAPACYPRSLARPPPQRAGGVTSKDWTLTERPPGRTTPSSPPPCSPARSLPASARPGPWASFLLQAPLPPSQLWGPCHSASGGESCSRWTPKQKRPKGDIPSGTPGSSATSAGRRTAGLQKPQEAVAGRLPLTQPGPAGHALGEDPFPARPGRVGRAPSLRGKETGCCLTVPCPHLGGGLSLPDPQPPFPGSKDPRLQTHGWGQEHRLHCQTGLGLSLTRWVPWKKR